MRNLVFISTLVGMLLLSGCGRLQPTDADVAAVPTAASGSVEVVAVAAGDTREALAADGAEVLLWRPDDGFALLRRSAGTGADGLAKLGRGEPDRDAVATPERHGTVAAEGWTAWSGGWTAWSGGWTAWSGGWTAWSGGEGSSLTPTENHPAWQRIGLFDAHAAAPRLGAGVTVAVIDTGIDLEHPAFAGHLAPAELWRDWVDGDRRPQEVTSEGGYSDFGHGTAVAGLVRQVAPEATILPLRVLRPDGSGDVSAVAQAMDHAIRSGADVINLSLGTATPSRVLRFMVEHAARRGVLVVASAGNSGSRRVVYPAADARTRAHGGAMLVGVGATEPDDALAPYSAFGRKLELFAPGSALHTPAPDERLAAWSGTSMAAGVVSGALALALAEGAAPAWLNARLNASADPLDAVNPGFEDDLGFGRLALDALFANAGEHDPNDDDGRGGARARR